MTRQMLSCCPNCGGSLQATRLECATCDTTILAHYDPCDFCTLSPASAAFVRDFMRFRGNLKEMERESRESYWTLRTRLSDVIKEMGYDEEEAVAPDGGETSRKRREVLDRLAAKEISAAEAAGELAALGAKAKA